MYVWRGRENEREREREGRGWRKRVSQLFPDWYPCLLYTLHSLVHASAQAVPQTSTYWDPWENANMDNELSQQQAAVDSYEQ